MAFAVFKIVRPNKIWASNKVKAQNGLHNFQNRQAQYSRALNEMMAQNGLHGFLKSHWCSFCLFLRKLLGLKDIRVFIFF